MPRSPDLFSTRRTPFGPRAALRAEVREHAVERLESRALMSGFSWSAAEVYLSELINRARQNPTAEAQRLGLDFTQGLSAGDAATLGPKEPLALDPSLTTAGRADAADMAARNFFDHINPDSLNPTQRAQAAGYMGTAGENIGAQYSTIDALYAAWMASPTERANILSLYQFFDSTYHYDQLGVGIAPGVSGSAYSSYYTAEFGNPSPTARISTLLGVIYNDADNNNFYGIGEGLANVRVDVARFTSSSNIIATYTTDAAGNYQLAVGPGLYTVKYTLVGTNRTYTKLVTIGTDNVEVSVTGAQLVSPPPPPPTDDFANAGQWSQAGVISINSTTGNGSQAGSINFSGDTDLFKFVVGKSGLTQLGAIMGTGGTPLLVRVFGPDHSPIALGSSSGTGGNDSSTSLNLVAGLTYFLQVEARSGTGTGTYTLSVQAPVDTGPGNSGGSTTTIPGGQAISVGLMADGKTSFAYIDSTGRPIFSRRLADGTWSSDDLFTLAGGPTLRGNLQTYVDPKDSLTYVVGVSDSGLILYRRDGAGTWTMRNLSTEVGVARMIVADPTVTIDASNRVQIVVRYANGAIADYWQNGQFITAANYRFRQTNMTATDLAAPGVTMPALTGDLTSWVTPGGDIQMAGLDASGRVFLFWRPYANGAYQTWQVANLTRLTGAARLSGTLCGVYNGGRTTISGVDASGNLWFLDQKITGQWRSRNITQAISGPALTNTGLTGYVNRMGASFVIGVTTSGDLVSYRYIYKDAMLMARWSFSLVSWFQPSVPVLAGTMDAVFNWATGVATISATSATGDPIRFTFSGTDGWTYENLSASL